MQIAAEHPEAEGERAGARVEERLLLDRVALHAADVAPRHVKSSAAIEPHLADAHGAVGDRALVAARVAADPALRDRLDELGRGLGRSSLQQFSERRHTTY